ncbi:MAG TPA: TolC family protein [Kofleriaceae bacterium]|nr:TolC family protein [Kofleriaceae bacterium]
MRLAVLASMVCAAGTASADDQLTLEHAVQLALAHNERSGIAELNVVTAEASVDRARSAFLPILSAGGSDNYAPWDKSPTNAVKGSLQLNVPIIDPSAFPLYGEAKHDFEAARVQSIDDKRVLEFDTAKAYIAVLLADQVVKSAEEKLVTSKAEVHDTTEQVKTGLTGQNDVTRADIDLGDSERELTSDQGSLEAAYVALEYLIASKVARGLVTPTTLIAASGKPLGSIDALVAAAIHARPDLEARREAAIAAHDFAREPRYRFFPSLGFTATGTAQEYPPPSGHEFDASFTLSASWTIYDAGQRAADAKSRDASAEIADLTTLELTREVEEQVRQAAAQLAAAQASLIGAKDAMDASRKSASETATLYKQGLAKAIELVDANEQRFLAEVNYAEAEFTQVSAYLALLQALGKGPLDPEGP